MVWGCMQGVFQSLASPARPSHHASAGLASHHKDEKLMLNRVSVEASKLEPTVQETLADFTRLTSTGSTVSDFGEASSICSFDGSDGVGSDCDEVSVEDLSPLPVATPVPRCCMRPLQIRVCSWNLNGCEIVDADDTTRWFKMRRATDIIVVGVQELIELKPSKVLSLEHSDPQRLAALEQRVESTVSGNAGEFVKVCSFGLAGLGMLVYVRKELASFVRQVCCDRIKTGFGGMVANKGGVRARFAVGNVSACFMNVHLPAGTGKAKAAKRDRHLHKIMSKAFQSTPTCGSFWSPLEQKPTSHDFTVVFGDLNSRPDMKANERCKAAKPSQARLEEDELLRGLLPSARGLCEGPVHFPPTFRYIPGTDEFSPRSSPAWCDRVLFKTEAGTTADLLEYSSFSELRHTSDHRPVAAQFQVSAPLGDSAAVPRPWP
mmetsp:Transcript_159781/g.387976  ORF Transcript_159781/g.387976 Transcript_159781/m.387976 type:complete len:433 (-) Transcript_159781:140-1438(-)